MLPCLFSFDPRFLQWREARPERFVDFNVQIPANAELILQALRIGSSERSPSSSCSRLGPLEELKKLSKRFSHLKTVTGRKIGNAGSTYKEPVMRIVVSLVWLACLSVLIRRESRSGSC